MKRRDLLCRIIEIARARGVPLRVSEGASHTKIRVGSVLVTVPRHVEIGEHTARSILKRAERATWTRH